MVTNHMDIYTVAQTRHCLSNTQTQVLGTFSSLESARSYASVEFMSLDGKKDPLLSKITFLITKSRLDCLSPSSSIEEQYCYTLY